ncbi:MAG TPA: hypothetical protein VF174_07020 [Micromonosporaceae bacterium]
MVEEVRPTLLDRARRLWAGREARKLSAAGHRALHRIDHLGPAWHVVEWPRTELPIDGVHEERAGFLTIGPGGVFAVTIADHGRSRVLIAGDVVQINGRRPPYVVEARRDAKRASRAISHAVGLAVPVTPVLTFVGSGTISVYGLPRDCLVATHRDLDQLLVAGGDRISSTTAQKLSEIARQPETWLVGSDAASYRWYRDGHTATGKR